MGAEVSAPMMRKDFDRLMGAVFGPDWREKAIVSPLGIFRLRDAPVEAGLEEPVASTRHVGLPQQLPARMTSATTDPRANAEAALAYVRERAGVALPLRAPDRYLARARGGFRTRPRIRYLRAAAIALRDLPDHLRIALDSIFDLMAVEDMQLACPHPPGARRVRHDARSPYRVCVACGLYLGTVSPSADRAAAAIGETLDRPDTR